MVVNIVMPARFKVGNKFLAVCMDIMFILTVWWLGFYSFYIKLMGVVASTV